MTFVERKTSYIVGWQVVMERDEVTLQTMLDNSPQAVWRYSDLFATYKALLDNPGTHTAMPDKSETYRVEGVNAILDNVGRVVPHDVCNIMLIEEDSLRFAYWRGYKEPTQTILSTYRRSLDHSIFQTMLETGAPYLTDTVHDPRWEILPGLEWIRASLSAPIRSHDETIGFLNLNSAAADAFTQSHAEWLSAFASEAALAIENARLFKQTRNYANELEERVRSALTPSYR